jgi:hypothetical protein
MRSKITFAGLAGFWIVMTILLWRWQSAAHSEIGSAIPVSIVWDKILTAPDNSALDIYDHEKSIGRCEWKATVGNVSQAMQQSLTEEYQPEGLIPEPTGYSLSIVNGFTTLLATNRVTFDMHLLLSTNRTWQDFHLSAKMRPTTWDIHAIAATQKIIIKITGGGVNWQRTLKFSDFDHPESLLHELDADGILGFFENGELPLQKAVITQAIEGLEWQAHEDWMQFGHSRMQVYRLETHFLGMHFYLFTSRVGEILWVEAPDKVTLRNVAFGHF